jgi:hypothetical protein
VLYYRLLLFSTENIGRANTRAILRVFASRSPNNTQKNGATRSIVRMGRRTIWCAILTHME